MIIVAGAHGVTIPSGNVYLWTNAEVLRDGGEPADYVKVFDLSGSFVSGMDCAGRALTAEGPAPTAAPQQPAANPAPHQPATQNQGSNQAPAASGRRQAATVAKSVPNTGGPAADGSPDYLLALGGAAVAVGAALMTVGMRNQVIAARMTPMEGERRTGPRWAVRNRRGHD